MTGRRTDNFPHRPRPRQRRQASRLPAIPQGGLLTTLTEGYIDDAPVGPFDAAACLLTLHFLDEREREKTVRKIHGRLKPGAPFVAAHSSFPQEHGARELWLDRYAAYAIASGVDTATAMSARNSVSASGTMLSQERDEEILHAGGFSDVQLFFSAFTWRGCIAYA